MNKENAQLQSCHETTMELKENTQLQSCYEKIMNMEIT